MAGTLGQDPLSNKEKNKKRQEKQKKYIDTPICKLCGKKHPSKAEDECWELEKNIVSRPSTWKSNIKAIDGARGPS
jgi:hypothetical protein